MRGKSIQDWFFFLHETLNKSTNQIQSNIQDLTMLHSISSKIKEEMNPNNNNYTSSSFDRFSQSLSSEESNLLQPVLDGISSIKSLMIICEVENEDQHLVTQEMLESLQTQINQLVGNQNREEEENIRIKLKDHFENLKTIISSQFQNQEEISSKSLSEIQEWLKEISSSLEESKKSQNLESVYQTLERASDNSILGTIRDESIKIRIDIAESEKNNEDQFEYQFEMIQTLHDELSDQMKNLVEERKRNEKEEERKIREKEERRIREEFISSSNQLQV